MFLPFTHPIRYIELFDVVVPERHFDFAVAEDIPAGSRDEI